MGCAILGGTPGELLYKVVCNFVMQVESGVGLDFLVRSITITDLKWANENLIHNHCDIA